MSETILPNDDGEFIASGANESESPPELQEDQTPAEPEEAAKPRGVQKRLDELTANWREEQRRSQQLEQLLAQALQGQQTQRQPEPQHQPATPQGKPTVEQYQSYEDYVEALADWKVGQQITQLQQQSFEAQRAAEEARQATEFQQRAATFADQHPDFQRVAFNQSLPVSPAMAEVIRTSEAGPELLYALGKEPAEAARIAALPPSQAGFALAGFWAARQPAKPNITPAPKPINPLAGGTATPPTDYESVSAEQFREMRRAELAKRR